MARFPAQKRAALENQIASLVENQKLQQWKAAEMLGVSIDFVNRACKRLGLETQTTGPRRGAQHPGWKGGSKIVKGYRYIYCPDHPFAAKNRYVAEHRLVMERSLRRYLLPGEVVHHIDGNPLNNRPNNLAAFQTNAAHLKHELTGKMPKWTPEGRKRTLEGVEKWRESRRALKRGGGQRPQTNARQT